MCKGVPIQRQQLPEVIKIQGGTGAGKEEARRRRSGGQDWRNDPPSGPEGAGPAAEAGRGGGGGGGWFKKWRRKDVIHKREPTGVARRVRYDVEGQ